MLEVIQSDFARLESETTAAEAEAGDAFQKYSADSATNKAVKETDVKHKTSKRQETESALRRQRKTSQPPATSSPQRWTTMTN